MVAAAGAAFVVGFYIGLFVLLALVGFGDVAGWHFELATIPPGSLLAGVGAALASPSSRRAMPGAVGAGIASAVLAVLLVRLLDGDYAIAIVGGGLVATVLTTGAAASA